MNSTQQRLSFKTDAAEKLCRQFPNHGNLTLARILYRDNRELFSSIERARFAIRYVRGADGERHRKHQRVENHSAMKSLETIPDGIVELGDAKPVVLRAEKMLVISDVHIPFHDKPALLAALRFGKQSDCDTCLLNGDFADFFSCRFWEKDPRKRNLANEIKTVRQVLAIVASNFQKTIWKLGNHEERWERYLKVKAPELLGIEEFEFRHIFKHPGVEFVDGKSLMQFGKLLIVHGHEFGKGVFSPVNAARGFFLRGMESMLAGHYHRTGEHSERSMSNRNTNVWATGCLCDLRPEYAPMNKWNHGFAVAEKLDSSGKFRVQNLKIINGEIY